MVVFGPHELLQRANEDPEFKIAARECNTDLKISVGDSACIFNIRDGLIKEARDDPGTYDAWDLEIGGPYEGWLKLLDLEPKPFYQDVYPAILKHDFYMGGDLEIFFAYHQAIRRMIELMRESRSPIETG